MNEQVRILSQNYNQNAMPGASPDGRVTYTTTDAGPAPQSYGAPGTSAEHDPSVHSAYQPPARARKRSTGTGSAGKPKRRGIFGFFGLIFKIRLIIGLTGLAGLGILGLMESDEGTVSTRLLGPGDCFEQIQEPDTQRVVVQDCAQPHGSQVYAEIQTRSGSRVSERCVEAYVEMQLDQAPLPADVELGVLKGLLSTDCIIVSPSGQLIGSVLD